MLAYEVCRGAGSAVAFAGFCFSSSPCGWGRPSRLGPSELVAWQGHEDRLIFVAFTPDGKRIVSGSDDSAIKVWDAGTGKESATLQEKGGHFLSLFLR